MDRYVAIGEASEALGVSIMTPRRWEVEGKLIPERTAGRQRRYDLAKLKPELFHAAPQDRKTIAYPPINSTASAGATIRMPWYCPSKPSRCLSPETIESVCPARAQAST